MRLLAAVLGTPTIALALAGCGHSTIRVVGVMQQSSEMRPLPNVPLGGYQQLPLFVRAAPGQSAAKYGSPEFSVADPDKIGHDPVAIKSIKMLDDKTVFIEIPNIKPVMQNVTANKQHYYRVVAGPFTASQAADIRTSLKQKSRIEATVARNCDTKSRANCIDING